MKREARMRKLNIDKIKKIMKEKNISEETLKKADAIEIKIGQGAKPGSGGLLLKNKITKEIAEIRGVTGEEDVHSPAYHKDIKDEKDLKRTVDYLRDITDAVS